MLHSYGRKKLLLTFANISNVSFNVLLLLRVCFNSATIMWHKQTKQTFFVYATAYREYGHTFLMDFELVLLLVLFFYFFNLFSQTCVCCCCRLVWQGLVTDHRARQPASRKLAKKNYFDHRATLLQCQYYATCIILKILNSILRVRTSTE